jgi:hypothetical protein
MYRCATVDTPAGPCGSRSIIAEPLEQWVWEQTREVLRRPELIEQELQRRKEVGPDENVAEDISKAKRNIARIDVKLRELIREFTDNEESPFSLELIRREGKRLEREKQDWENTLRKAEQRLAQQSRSVNGLEFIRDNCARLAANLESSDFETRRLALEALCVTVFVDGGDWRLDGLIPVVERDKAIASMWIP